MDKIVVTKTTHVPDQNTVLLVFDSWYEVEDYIEKEKEDIKDRKAPSATVVYHMHKKIYNSGVFYNGCIIRFYYIFTKLGATDEAKLVREYDVSYCTDLSSYWGNIYSFDKTEEEI